MNSRTVARGCSKSPPCQRPTTMGLLAPMPATIRPGANEARVAKPMAVRAGERV